MPLPSSGQLTLDDIHVEAGGTSLSEAGINDADIRGLLSPTPNSGDEMEFSDWYGASANITVPIDFYEHGYGNAIGTISVYIVDSTGAIITPISGGGTGGLIYASNGDFSIAGSQFRRVQRSPVIASQSYRILWYYVKNDLGNRGDYAIRDAVVDGTTYNFASNATGWLTTTATSYTSAQSALSNASAVATSTTFYRWNRRTGSTPTTSTGPTTTAGVYYLYAEASNTYAGDTWYLFSPLVT